MDERGRRFTHEARACTCGRTYSNNPNTYNRFSPLISIKSPVFLEYFRAVGSKKVIFYLAVARSRAHEVHLVPRSLTELSRCYVMLISLRHCKYSSLFSPEDMNMLD